LIGTENGKRLTRGNIVKLKDILQSIMENGKSVILNDGNRDWRAEDLLTALSPVTLDVAAHYQPGLYIAEISASGYLGTVLYRVKPAEEPGG
jgi:hypothetical protein